MTYYSNGCASHRYAKGLDELVGSWTKTWGERFATTKKP